ncbi:class A beta-lactamase [bacterium]|nr:MAG: class A beta-lactamase [bacterium]
MLPILPVPNLAAEIQKIEASLPGARIGVAAQRFGGARFDYRGAERFPLQSVFKYPLAVAVLRAVDVGKLKLDGAVILDRSNLSVPYSPLGETVLAKGPLRTTWAELVKRAVSKSDNTAADVLMRRIGGPSTLTATLRSLGVTGVRIDRYESRLQCDCSGIARFTPDLTSEAGFNRAKARLSKPQRLAALKRALAEVRDTSTPNGMLTFLRGYDTGGWLSALSKNFLDRTLFETMTGPDRLRAGFGPDWKLRHKTGTGGDVYGRSPARNDVGIATAKDGSKIAIAVFLTGASGRDKVRDAAIAKVTRLVRDSLTQSAEQ